MQIEASLAELLRPISTEQPCGVPVRYEPEYDVLREARREDDATLPAGVWQADIKRADWNKVQQLASTVLCTRSKDLIVASWLGEAWLHLEGLVGLARALALLVLLGERFSEQVHPVPEDGDTAYRAGALQWLAQEYAETLRLQVPLLPGILPGLTLDGWQQLHSRLLTAESAGSKARSEKVSLQRELEQFQAAANSLSEKTLHQLVQDISVSRDWLGRLDNWCNQRLAEEAPSFKPIYDVLQQMEAILFGLLEQHPASALLQFNAAGNAVATVGSTADPVEITVAATTKTGDASQAGGVMLPPLASREQAYQSLQLIANYLSAIEPHSPVPYFLRQAVDWGRKPLPELLSELIEADDNARRLWKQLGVLS